MFCDILKLIIITALMWIRAVIILGSIFIKGDEGD